MKQDSPHFFCQLERDRSYMPQVASLEQRWAAAMRVVSHEYGHGSQELNVDEHSSDDLLTSRSREFLTYGIPGSTCGL